MMWLLVLVACGGADATDTGSRTSEGDPCDDAPVLTWENFGEGFLRENCESCHAEDAPYRSSAETPPPDAIHFGDKETALSLRTQILDSAAGDSPRMPPRGGVDIAEREKLDIWLRCWVSE